MSFTALQERLRRSGGMFLVLKSITFAEKARLSFPATARRRKPSSSLLRREKTEHCVKQKKETVLMCLQPPQAGIGSSMRLRTSCIVYRFRRDNEVQVDCSVVSEKPLPADSTFSLSYPISKEYEIEGLTRDVYKLGLSRPRDDGYASLCFRSRATLGGGKARKMKVSVKAGDNVLSPTHDRVLTLCAPLSAPVKSAEGPCKTFDGSWLASFCFSIPHRLSWWW